MKTDLRDTPEQASLFDSFRSNHLYVKSTRCPCCCDHLESSRRIKGWERGTCGKLTAVKCTNCGYIRATTPREPQRFRGLTIGQEKAISRFAAKLERFKGGDYEIETEVHKEPWAGGKVSVRFGWCLKNANATQRVYCNGSCQVVFGIKGGGKIYSHFDGISTKEHCAKLAGYLASYTSTKLDLI